MAATADKSKPYIPLASQARDGWSKDGEATATCFCGAVQMVFPTKAPGFVDSFVCNCSDCRKITASMFASNFVVRHSHTSFVRGRELLKQYGPQSKTVASGHEMANLFCGECGTLMYREGSGFPGMAIMRIGTVDDFNLHETALKPRVEQFTKDRVAWLSGVEGAEHVEGSAFG